MATDFGQRISFWELLKRGAIVIPTIQRDYTYGSDTPETNKVLNHLLDDLRHALLDVEAPVLTLDFVYGSTDDTAAFSPLDGQQRLTTLFLLHYYAASLDDLSVTDRNVLSNFKYATRMTTVEFCGRLLDSGFAFDFASVVSLSAQLRNKCFFLPSFEDDPTIRSMLVVLDRIHEKFGECRDQLWGRLTGKNCKVNFDVLDFGQFGLSDDLYIKMNARGKPLSRWEIFKSKFEQKAESLLGEKGRDVLRGIARHLDTVWSDMLWVERGEHEELIDESYVNLFGNLLAILHWLHDPAADALKMCDSLNLSEVNSRADVDFINSFFRTFSDAAHNRLVHDAWAEAFFSTDEVAGNDAGRTVPRIRAFRKDGGDVFISALKGVLDLNDQVLLYGFYLWVKGGRTDENALRHLRNLIENSSYEIRMPKMCGLLKDVDSIFAGKLIEKTEPDGFNVNQWAEERRKEFAPERWRTFFSYENHTLLRGAVGLFVREGDLDLADEAKYAWTLRALEGFSYVFGSDDDHQIRKALLSCGDFTQSPVNHPAKRILGCSYADWRNHLVKSGRRVDQQKIIDMLHGIEAKDEPFVGRPVADVRDWRYYAVKYSDDIYFTNAGYYYREDHPQFDRPLEIISMNSSLHSENFLEWRLLNVILKRQFDREILPGLSLSIDPHGSKPLLVDGKVGLTVKQTGWQLVNAGEDVERALSGCGVTIEDHVCIVRPGYDVVEFGKEVVVKIHGVLRQGEVE